MADIGAYGTWRSAVTAHDVARTVDLRVVAMRPHGLVWWEEIRPAEGGRRVLACGAPYRDVEEPVAEELAALGADRGTGSWLPVAEDAVVVAHEWNLYLVRSGRPARALTDGAAGRYRDLVATADGRQVWCVREAPGTVGPEQVIAVVPLDGSGAVRTLVTATACLGTPRPSADRASLAWISWEYPQAPWDGAQLWVARVTAAGVANARPILGGHGESVFQPEWASSDSLYVISDRSRWWNPYQARLDGTLRPLGSWPEDFGWPQDTDGLATYARLTDGPLAVLHGTQDWRLDVLHPATGVLEPLDLPYTAWQPRLRVWDNIVAAMAGSPTHAAAIVVVNTTNGQHRALRASSAPSLRDYAPPAQWATFAGRDGHEVHALVHPPHHPDYRGSQHERSPYLLFVRDSPDRANRMLNPVTTFFTSRGIGVADICCRGTSGFGRGYREQIYGRWGVADVEDCVVAGRGLVARYGADPTRLVVRGTGAGGATALGVLAHTNLCVGATVYAGITDLDDLATQGSHAVADHFRALAADSTLQRGTAWLESIRHPVLIVHGGSDEIVPPSQSRLLEQALRRGRVPHAWLSFAGEGHRFRRAETIGEALRTELGFYGQVLGFTPADATPLALRST